MQSNLTYQYEPELIRLLAEGQTAAFTSIYQRYYYRVFSYAKKLLGSEQDAEDMTADTFVKLWNAKDSFDSIEKITGFLLTTVRNACFNFLRHQQVRINKADELQQSANDAAIDFSVQEIREDFFKQVYAEVEKMPKKMKAIFLLSYAEGLKPAEIAAKLNLSVTTISNQKTNALKLLRVAFSDKPLLLTLLIYLEMRSH